MMEAAISISIEAHLQERRQFTHGVLSQHMVEFDSTMKTMEL